MFLMLMTTIVIFIVMIVTRYKENHNSGSSNINVDLDSYHDYNDGAVENDENDVENYIYDEVLLQESSSMELEPRQTDLDGGEINVHSEMNKENEYIEFEEIKPNEQLHVVARTTPPKPPRKVTFTLEADLHTDSGLLLYSTVNKVAPPAVPPKRYLD